MSDPDESSSDLSSTEDESSELESSLDNTEGLEGVVRLPPAASSFIVSSAEESPTKATHSETSKKVKRRKNLTQRASRDYECYPINFWT